MKAFRFSLLIILSVLLTLSSFAHHKKLPSEFTHTVYSIDDNDEPLLRRYAPLFLAYDSSPNTTALVVCLPGMTIKETNKYLWTAVTPPFIT